jgi:eukaryotic-like serine/threonine-protein kinase
MSNTGHKSLDEIVREALTMAPQDQLQFIREACATDEVLYASAVARLHSGEYSSNAAFGDDAGAEDAFTDPSGQLIGPYRVVRSLGRGGMGEVFLAERADDQFQQRVAIKLVRRGLLSRHVQGRLRLERQILATLDHPNIARLFDGGATDDGTPYIVMEYVDGEPIDTYADRGNLTIEQRLKLFVTVCSAVHKAHQNLVVHRDLKPSNILVTADGVPKLLDFGIAKLLDDRQMMHTMAVTQADFRVMTPDHASPEQIRGEPITTASDIYVLGVLLYELLSGYKPFVLRGNRLAELEQAICEHDPAPPSAAIRAAMTAPHSGVQHVASDRGVSPAKLRRQLSGDLDNIVLMAMRKEPERRYSSVEQFAADVERCLRGMPVIARADAWPYRAGKFVRRHALVVGLCGAFLAVLIGFTITTVVQSEQIRRERDFAEAERVRAQSEQARAEAVSEFLINSFRRADPARSRGKDITAKEILASGATSITKEMRSQPALQATLLDTIGSVYLSLGLTSDAKPLIEQALSVRRALFGRENLDVARSLYSLDRVFAAQGDLEKADELARESLAIHRKLTGERSVETAGSLCRLGVVKSQQGELAAAEQLFNQCLDIRVERLGGRHELVTVPLDNLARLAQEREDYTRAESLYRRTLQIDALTRGKDHPQSIRHLHNLATAIQARGDLATAEPLMREAIDLYRRVLTEQHPETIDAMSNLGSLLMDKRQFEEARKTFETTLAANRKVRGELHMYVGHDLAYLARLAFMQHNHAEAEQRISDALRIYRATLSPTHGYIASALTLQGRIRLGTRDLAGAEQVLVEAMNAWRGEYGERSAEYASARAPLGRTRALQRRIPEAESALLESYAILIQSPRRAHQETAAEVRRWIEDLYRSVGRPEAAREYFARLKESA